MNWTINGTIYSLNGVETSLYDLIKALRNEARKQRDVASLSIFQVVLGDADRVIANEGSITNEKFIKLIQKVIAGNNEILSQDSSKQNLKSENEILEVFLPKMWSAEEVEAHLKDNTEFLEETKDSNIGLSIKYAVEKMAGLPVQKSDIANVVKKLKG